LNFKKLSKTQANKTELQVKTARFCKIGRNRKGGFKSEETGGFLLLQNKYSKSLSRE
jgi:hypothetical protein